MKFEDKSQRPVNKNDICMSLCTVLPNKDCQTVVEMLQIKFLSPTA